MSHCVRCSVCVLASEAVLCFVRIRPINPNGLEIGNKCVYTHRHDSGPEECNHERCRH
jgi:hypothetical protein